MSSSYRSSRLGLSHWDHYAIHRGGCLELYYCIMVEWCWWDSSLIRRTNWLPSVLWHCLFGHMTCKSRPTKWPIMCWVGRYASTLLLWMVRVILAVQTLEIKTQLHTWTWQWNLSIVHTLPFNVVDVNVLKMLHTGEAGSLPATLIWCCHWFRYLLLLRLLLTVKFYHCVCRCCCVTVWYWTTCSHAAGLIFKQSTAV